MLATDYENYAVTYTCYSWLGAWNYEYLWVLVREPARKGSKLWSAYKEVTLKAIKDGFIDKDVGNAHANTTNYLRATEQKGKCIYQEETQINFS